MYKFLLCLQAGFRTAMQQIFVDRKMTKPEYAATHQLVFYFVIKIFPFKIESASWEIPNRMPIFRHVATINDRIEFQSKPLSL